MSTLIVFFSYTGTTKKMAQELAEEKGAALAEVKPVKVPSKLMSILRSNIGNMEKKSWPIKPLEVDLNDFDHIIFMSPVWSYRPSPYISQIIDKLPPGKTVEFYMLSAGGVTKKKDQVVAKVKQAGCTVTGWQEVKSNMTPVGSISYVFFKAKLNK